MAGRPTVLTAELVDKAAELANDGLPLDMIADAIGVHVNTCRNWLKAAREGDPCDLKQAFLWAISRAQRNWTKSLVGSVRAAADEGNAWAATWMLTHHPAMRDHFSDAAADRRVERRTVSETIAAIMAAGIPPEHERRILDFMDARGLTGEPEPQA